MSGFITMHREALDHPLLKDADRFRAWFWLIANACWKPTKVQIKGDVIELQRGELSFSQRFLAEKWGWSKSRVDRFISDLRDHDMIETRSKIGASAGHNAGQGQSILTICNYAKYQDQGEAGWGNDEPQSGATAGQQRGNSGAKKNKGTREQDIANAISPLPPTTDDPQKSEGKGKAKEPKPKPESGLPWHGVPDWMPLDAWHRYLKDRQERRKQVTARAAELIIADLDRFRAEGMNPGDVLDQSVRNRWIGVFPLKTKEHHNGSDNRRGGQQGNDQRSTLARVLDGAIDQHRGT